MVGSVVISVICVPWMLLLKPLILKMLHGEEGEEARPAPVEMKPIEEKKLAPEDSVPVRPFPFIAGRGEEGRSPTRP